MHAAGRRQWRTPWLAGRYRWAGVALGTAFLIVGCGDGRSDLTRAGEALNNLPGETQPPIPASVDCTTITSKAPNRITQLIGIAKDVVNVLGSQSVTGSLSSNLTLDTDLMNTLMSGPSTNDQLTALKKELDCTAQGLDWKMLALAYNDDQWAPVSSALNEALEVGITRGDAYDANSATGVQAACGFPMDERTWVESSTDAKVECNVAGLGSPSGAPYYCNWKDIVASHEPSKYDDNQVFDWRLGLPWLSQLIGMRLMTIAAEDPLYAIDEQWNLELETGAFGTAGYRQTLQQRLQLMTQSITCGKVDNWDMIDDGWGSFVNADVVCADSNTGMAERQPYWASPAEIQSCGGYCCLNESCFGPLTSNAAIPIEDTLRRQLLAQMPIFQVQSMIDTLRRLTHPWVPDLTVGAGRIPVAANQSLCLDVQWGNADSGTPVWIWDCTGGAAQQWTYDRVAQTITNTAFGKCLQADPSAVSFVPGTGQGFLTPGAAIAQIGDCVTPAPAWQQWSYDPEKGVLHNGLGLVLDIQWNNLQAGTTVWLWDENDGTAQQWYADRSNDYCSSLCNTKCLSQCGTEDTCRFTCTEDCLGNCDDSATP